MSDLRRIILSGLLFLTGMTLWNAWEKEHIPKPLPVSAASSEFSTGQNQSSLPASSSFNNNTPNPAPDNISNRYITVKTDYINAVIDRIGGNITQLQLLKYPLAVNQPYSPITLLSSAPEAYYLVKNGITGDNLTNANMIFQQERQNNTPDRQTVILSAQNPAGIKITKTYIFPQKDYLISVKQSVFNNSTLPWQGKSFYLIQRKAETAAGMGPFNFNTYTGAVVSSRVERYQKLPFKKMPENPLSQTIQNGWLAMTQHYFLSAWIPSPAKNYDYYTQVSNSEADNPKNAIYTIGMKSGVIQLAPKQAFSETQQLYAGPELSDRLEKIAPGLKLTVDYGVLWFIASIIFDLMKKLYALTGNWGWAIVLVTLTIKALFYKLNSISFQSMAKMRRLQPKLEQLRQQTGGDRQKLAQATMELYRREKANPMSGCLPLIVQIPVFLSLYWVIIESVELRQAPFILWIHDLSAKDPYYILPLLMGLTIFIQQWLSPKPADPVQQKVMMMMPIVFTAFFFTFPAGLVLYWIVNNSLSILQQWYIMNHVASEEKIERRKKIIKIDKN